MPQKKVDVAPLLGSWKITYMEEWRQDYVDLVVPGHITFEFEGDHLLGSFQFGTVVGWMDCRVQDTTDGPTIEWSWQGQSDSDPGCGRGWARLEGNKLIGRIFIHASDDSKFEASRRAGPLLEPRRVATAANRGKCPTSLSDRQATFSTDSVADLSKSAEVHSTLATTQD
jgi:hypothetical protein